MAYQSVFKRYETKYMMTDQQRAAILEAMRPYMRPDDYGHATIRNIYFDTDSYRLARRSLEKPVYKEKLRIRSYREAQAQDLVFVELKKKYDDVVYKRREPLPQAEALKWLADVYSSKEAQFPKATQIGREIDYFFRFYQNLKPKIFLSYEREAFYALDGSGLRITFDENILARQEALSLSEGAWGEALVDEGRTLMEIKTWGAIPLWLAKALAHEKIYKMSFSKYGMAYRTMVCTATYGTAHRAMICKEAAIA